MMQEHGQDAFLQGCPVCKEKCCCGKNRSSTCRRTVSGYFSTRTDTLTIFFLVPLLQKVSNDKGCALEYR